MDIQKYYERTLCLEKIMSRKRQSENNNSPPPLSVKWMVPKHRSIHIFVYTCIDLYLACSL